MAAEAQWEGDEYVVRIRGRMREAVALGTDLELMRQITTVLGETRLRLHDRIENLSTRRTTEWIEDREVGPEAYTAVQTPTVGAGDVVFVHDLVPDAQGQVAVALLNERLGLGRNRAAGTLQHIEPGEVREFHLEMGVLDGAAEMEAFAAELT